MRLQRYVAAGAAAACSVAASKRHSDARASMACDHATNLRESAGICGNRAGRARCPPRRGLSVRYTGCRIYKRRTHEGRLARGAAAPSGAARRSSGRSPGRGTRIATPGYRIAASSDCRGLGQRQETTRPGRARIACRRRAQRPRGRAQPCGSARGTTATTVRNASRQPVARHNNGFSAGTGAERRRPFRPVLRFRRAIAAGGRRIRGRRAAQRRQRDRDRARRSASRHAGACSCRMRKRCSRAS